MRTVGEGAGRAIVIWRVGHFGVVFRAKAILVSFVPNIAGSIIGVLMLGVLLNGLTDIGASIYVQMMATGIVIIASVVVAGLSKKQRA